MKKDLIQETSLLGFLEENISSGDLRREFEDCIHSREGFLLDYLDYEDSGRTIGWVLSRHGNDLYQETSAILQNLPEGPNPVLFKELQYETQRIRSELENQAIDTYIIPDELESMNKAIGSLLRLMMELRGEIPWKKLREYQILLKRGESTQALRERLNLFDRLWEEIYLQMQDQLPLDDVNNADSDFSSEEMPQLLPHWWVELKQLCKTLSMKETYPDCSLFEIWLQTKRSESAATRQQLEAILDELTEQSEELSKSQGFEESDY